MATDWRAEYAKAAALQETDDVSEAASSVQQPQKTPEDGVLAFVDLLLAQEGGEWWVKLQRQAKRAAKQSDGHEVELLPDEDKKRLRAMKKRLAAVAKELLLELSALNASVSSKDAPRAAKVRVLQLQLVLRMLSYGTLARKKKEQRKTLKKEIRGLLDRVALLLDAANPPSLADEDADERSPFQEFLQEQLAPRLKMLLPELVQYLLRAYELEEEEDANDEPENEATTAMLPPLLPTVKPPQPPDELPTSAATGKGSILSALRQERPAKRTLQDATGLFKERKQKPQRQKWSGFAASRGSSWD
ncbi:Lysine-specific demethylase 8 [Phytophthora cinnamomi]|uniref:Lysine-specific demethylase 8 n=1 Tax=Phytophthora cinnamomi TaxID=4785 RepID=UPI00355A02EF|nr:Lysine-specific demethylase 8 [Phytophthora cinnamomi]